MNAYIDTIKVTDENGEKSILYPRTKQEAVEGLEERLVKLEVADITETEDTTLENSNAGRLLFTEIKGAMEQGANPSPTNPQEIKNVAISGIRTHGKNFLDCRGLTEQTIDGVAFTPVYKNGMLLYVNVNGTPTKQCTYLLHGYKKTEGGLILNGCTGGSSSTYSLLISYYDENKNWKKEEYQTKSMAEILTNYAFYTISIMVRNGVTMDNVKFYPMIRSSDIEDATYEPYTESSITFSQLIELYGLNDARGILTSKKIKRKYVKVVFDGSESWLSTSTVGKYYINSLGCKRYGYVMCSQANRAVGSTDVLNTCYLHDTSNGRFIINTEFATVDEWKAHLASNPMTVVYEMAEETTEELPIADQIALNSLPTYDGITYVEFISDVQPTFSAKYGTTEMGGMTLESLLTARSNDLRLSAVESAVVNNI